MSTRHKYIKLFSGEGLYETRNNRQKDCKLHFPGNALQDTFPEPIKRQCCPHIETSQLISTANQMTGLHMRATLVFNGLIIKTTICPLFTI